MLSVLALSLAWSMFSEDQPPCVLRACVLAAANLDGLSGEQLERSRSRGGGDVGGYSDVAKMGLPERWTRLPLCWGSQWVPVVLPAARMPVTKVYQ